MFSFPNIERRSAWIRQVVAAGRQSAEENSGIELPIYILDRSSSEHSETNVETNVGVRRAGFRGSESSLDSMPLNSNRAGKNEESSQVSVDMSVFSSESGNTSRNLNCHENACDTQQEAMTREGHGSSTSLNQRVQGLFVIKDNTSHDMDGDDAENSSKFPEQDFGETVKPGVALGGIVLAGVVLAAVGEELGNDLSDGNHDEAQLGQPNVIEMEPAGSRSKPEFSGDMPILNERPSMLLKQYYDMMYYCGIIAYNIGGKTHEDGRSCSSLRGFFQKLAFWILTTLSLYSSFSEIKYNFMLAVSKDSKAEYSTFVYIAFNMAAFVAKLYIIFLFFFNKKVTGKMFQSMEDFERIYDASDVSTRPSCKRHLVSVLALSTLAITGSKQILWVNSLGTQEIILQTSREFFKDLLIWNPETMQNDTILLQNELGENMTNPKIALGLTFILCNTANDLQLGMILDLVIVVCIVMSIYSRKFTEEIKAITENIPKENLQDWTDLQHKRELAWNKYRMIQLIVADINHIFDPLLKLLHICNLLSYAFFMAHIFFDNFSWRFFFFFAVNLVKAEIGYYIAGNIAQVNDVIETWIHNWAEETGKFVVDGKEKDAGMQLDQLSKKPIGIGKGIFLIHQTFHYKFMGLVGSVFFSMANEENNA